MLVPNPRRAVTRRNRLRDRNEDGDGCATGESSAKAGGGRSGLPTQSTRHPRRSRNPALAERLVRSGVRWNGVIVAPARRSRRQRRAAAAIVISPSASEARGHRETAQWIAFGQSGGTRSRCTRDSSAGIGAVHAKGGAGTGGVENEKAAAMDCPSQLPCKSVCGASAGSVAGL